MPGSCVEVVAEREELEGYRVAVVKDSALNKTRYTHALLLVYMHVHIHTALIINSRLKKCCCIYM